jgi:Glyoxalase-like domain
MAAMLREIIIDCNDPRLVADFWSQVLAWKVQEHHGVLWMSESGDWRDLRDGDVQWLQRALDRLDHGIQGAH